MLWLLVQQRLPHRQGTVLGWEETCFMISRRICNLIIIILWINFGACHQPSLGAAGHVLVEYSLLAPGDVCIRVFVLELETKAIRRFANVSIVSYSRPSLMKIASASQFYVYFLS